MKKEELFELMLDNIPYGLYILDDKGNYIYANSVYLASVGMTKSELLSTNVSSFLEQGAIPFSVSHIVYREKRSVSIYQDVNISSGLNVRSFRQLIVSNPVFDETGDVQNIVASCFVQEWMDALVRKAENNTADSMTLTLHESRADEAPIVAASEAMQSLLLMARTVAKTDAAVLVSGESGTGKEVIAQYIHRESARNDGPLVVINCASLPENLLEAELFGYESGASKRAWWKRQTPALCFLTKSTPFRYPCRESFSVCWKPGPSSELDPQRLKKSISDWLPPQTRIWKSWLRKRPSARICFTD